MDVHTTSQIKFPEQCIIGSSYHQLAGEHYRRYPKLFVVITIRRRFHANFIARSPADYLFIKASSILFCKRRINPSTLEV